MKLGEKCTTVMSVQKCYNASSVNTGLEDQLMYSINCDCNYFEPLKHMLNACRITSKEVQKKQ